MDRIGIFNSGVSFLLAVAIGSSATFGGIVEFSPANQNVDPSGNTMATFEVTIIPEVQGGFDTLDMVLGSQDEIRIAGFTFSETWTSLWPYSTVMYPDPAPRNELLVSANSPVLIEFDSLLVGTLLVDATGLADGVYTFGVDANWDGFSTLGQMGVSADPLFGSATVTVPEPSMIVLLGLGSLVFMHRGKAYPTRRLRSGL